MTWDAVAVRARGLGTHRLAERLPASPAAREVEDAVRDRRAAELAILARWARPELATIMLDEDRRSLRGLARGVVASVVPSQRIAGAVATASLPQRLLVLAAGATTFAEVARLLATHPLAPAFTATELIDVELGLARLFFANARTRDPALALYVAQLADVENASTALLVAERGGDLQPEDAWIAGGSRLGKASFLAACTKDTREHLARAFAGTPIANALFDARSGALEDAALAWQLAMQTRLRRSGLGCADVLCFVLERRREAHELRRAAWRALGGGA
jgi:hypothetical protein